MKKRLLSFLLVAAMIFSSGGQAIPVRAADSGSVSAKAVESTRIEAEDCQHNVTDSNLIAVIEDSKFSSGKAVCLKDKSQKGHIIFDYEAEQEGTYFMTIAYESVTSSSSYASIYVQVNDSDWMQIDPGANSEAAEMKYVSLQATLKEGHNTIKCTANYDASYGLEARLDYMDIRYLAAETHTGGADSGTLSDLGFHLDGETYRTNDLEAGSHTISAIDEMVKEYYQGASNSRYIRNPDRGDINVKSSGESSSSGDYKVSASFDGTGDGKKDYIARLSLENGRNGGTVRLSVEKIDGSATVFTNVDTGGYILTKAKYNVEKWEVLGLINLAAGDFDGDGIDELAIYAPNNSDSVESTKAPWTPAREEIRIYDIDVEKDTTLREPTKIIDITAGTGEWGYTSCGGTKNYYSFPYLSMTADDVNGDGIDDLLTVANFANDFRAMTYNFRSYTWSQVLDVNSCFASVLDVYEGSKSEMLKQTVKKRPLIGKTGDSGAYVLRNASAVVGDITGAGSREIILAGNYTSVSYNSSTTTNTTVTSTRAVTVKESSNQQRVGVIVGFTDYSTMKRNTAAASSLSYSWTLRESGSPKLKYNNKNYKKTGRNKSNFTAEPVAVAAFAAYGSALPDTVFVEGELFSYNNEGKLGYIDYVLPDEGVNTDGNCWISYAVAGNISNSAIGAESLCCLFGREYVVEENYETNYVEYGYGYSQLEIYGTVSGGDKGYKKSEYNSGSNRLGIVMADIDDDGSFIRYEEGNTDIYYGDVEVYSVLQAAPVWKELGEDYAGGGNTSYSKSKGSETGETDSVSISAGVVMGFEQDVSFLGLFQVAGMEFEHKLSASVGYESEKTTSKEFSTAYDTSGPNDVAVLFTVPYVRYNCKMYLPGYYMATQNEYEAKRAFQEELEKNILTYVDMGAAVVGGTYSKPNDGYNNAYTTDVTSSNYQSQIDLNNNYVEWLEMTEANIAELGGGGIYHWGTLIMGGWQDYYYCIPQTPMLTTVDVSTYDKIAETEPNLEPIYGNIFDENYVAGDPSTYARTISALKTDGSPVLAGQTNVGSSEDTNGFITSSPISSSSSAPSQTISVSKSDAKTVTYGASLETEISSKVGGVKVGAAFTVETEGSNCWTTTEGNEYSGTVPNLPGGTGNAYTYGWKMVAYSAKLNGKTVPVVGYLTRFDQTPPPSVPTDISVTGQIDSSIDLQWSAGNRPAASYEVYRVMISNNKEYYTRIGTVSEDDNGIYSFTDDADGQGLDANTEYHYAVKAFSETGIVSAYSELISATTLPSGMDFKIELAGIDSDTTYFAGKDIPLSVNITSETESRCTVLSYEWQCNTGNGWVTLNENSAVYTLRTSTLKNGYQYRCKLEVLIGSTTNGTVYDWYTTPVTQQAKRVGTKLALAASDEGSADTELKAYAKKGTTAPVSAQVVPEAESDVPASGKVTFRVDYYDSDPEAETAPVVSRSVPEPVSTVSYEVEIDENGAAATELAFTNVGYYLISAAYDGNINYEGSYTEDAFTYQIYPDSEYDFSEAIIKIDSSYTAGSEEVLSYDYTGEQICPVVSVEHSDLETVSEGNEYQVTYGTNTAPGEKAGSITITPLGCFAMQRPAKVFFDIWKNFNQADVAFADGEVLFNSDDSVYVVMTDDRCEPDVKVTYMDEILTEGKDYTVVYKNNTKTGETATVEITGKGDFTSETKNLTFAILERPVVDISRFTDQEKDASYIASTSKFVSYDRENNILTILPTEKPIVVTGTNTELTIKAADKVEKMLWKDVYFQTLDLTEDKGSIEIILEGENKIISQKENQPAVNMGEDEENSPVVTFAQMPVEEETDIEQASLILTGGDNAPAMYNENGRVIFADAAFELNAGSGETIAVVARSVVLKNTEPISNVNIIYSVKSIDAGALFSETVITIGEGETAYEYTGSQICPDVYVTCKDATLVKDMDYSVSYGSNTAVGVKGGSITVEPKGIFADQESRTVYFDIIKALTTITTSRESYTATVGDAAFSLGAQTASGETLSYSGYDADIISVDEYGNVTPKKEGSTSITISITDSENYRAEEKVVTIEINAKEEENPGEDPGDNPGEDPGDNPGDNPGGNTNGNDINNNTPDPLQQIKVTVITITGESKKIAAGKKLSLALTVAPENAANSAVSWESSNTKYATVSPGGVVTTKKAAAGKKVIITATAQDGSGIKASYTISIVKHAVKSVKITSKTNSVKAGKTLRLKTKVTTTGKTAYKTLLWSSSNTKYATVSSKGVVKASKKAKGKKVKITARAVDGSGKKASITIKIK